MEIEDTLIVDGPITARSSLAVTGAMTVAGQNVNTARTPLHSYTPEQFGAVGNTPAHDDAPGIEAAIFAAVAACIADQSYVCEVVFGEKFYYANRAPVVNQVINGLPSYASAQIAIPFVPFSYAAGANSPVVHLILRSVVPRSQEGSPFINVPPAIVSTPTTGGGVQNGGGVASVVGGAAFTGTSSISGNHGINGIHVVWEGIGIAVPPNPPFTALDLCSFWNVHIVSGEFKAPQSGYEQGYVPCTNLTAYGVVLPYTSGTIQLIDYLEVSGFYVGINTAEHIDCGALWLYGNRISLQPGPSAHGGHIRHLQTTQDDYSWATHTDTVNVFTSVASPMAPMVIGLWDSEGAAVLDASNNLRLTVNYMTNGSSPGLTITGGGKCVITFISQATGYMSSPPTVPASGTAYKNFTGRNAWVVVAGGAVTGIAVDGQATGLTTGQILVPNGKTVTLTYSAAPTWSWFLF